MVTPEAYGAVGNGTTDDYAAMQSALNSGQTVRLTEGKTYRIVINWMTTPNLGLVIPANTTLDTSNATINLEIAGNAYGIRLQSNSHICGHGNINVTAISNVDSLQGIIQSVISIGACYGEVTSVSSLGPFITATGWSVEGVTLSTIKPNGLHISCVGGVSGIIRDVRFPSNAYAFGCINCDWGTVGTLGTIPANKTAWSAGTFYTVHPSNILIESVSIGDMSNSTSIPIRLSGTDNITVRNFRIAGSRAIGVAHYGGDYGYEFAQAGSPQRRAFMGTSITNGKIDNTNSGEAIHVDAFADNIFRESGYTPTLNPIYHSNIIVDDIHAEGNFSGTSHGVMVNYIDGATVRDVDMIGFSNGVCFGDYTTNCNLERSRVWGNMSDGVYIGGSLSAPTDISVTDSWICNNGANSTNAGIRSANGSRHYLQHNILGGPGEGGQYYGIYVASTDAFIFSNYVKAIKSGGAGISKGSTVQIAWNFFDPSIPSSRQII